MAVQRKLGKPTAQRMALLRGQVTDLLWYGKIETTYARAKEVQRIAEKIITKAIKTYTDTYKKVETRKTAKGQDIKVEIVNDGPKKLAVRRAIMGMVSTSPKFALPKKSWRTLRRAPRISSTRSSKRYSTNMRPSTIREPRSWARAADTPAC